MNKLLKLFLAVFICEGVGILGSIFTIPAITTWYQTLNKPVFSPPNYVFGPVWTTLYALMGISIFLILEKKIKLKEKHYLIYLFSWQLLLNFLWSVIFFYFHFPLLAFLEIILLWGSILLLIINFWKYSKTASYLLVPYLLWVSFASLLNAAIVILNK
jgi:tryptophan-rich sensory protein